ncbi:MAG: thiamine pyrophosphate-dependent enzyme [Dehalococcoidales bacterium]|nr:thiamine pyrophosphate-dependent enzyme [Dehalococcoidales bacterium]
MPELYDILKAQYGKCPPDCSACQEACVAERTGEEACSGITAIHIPEMEFHSVTRCSQCSEPACASICITGAITKSDTDGIVRIDNERCLGCGLCTLACPYGAMSYNPDKQKAFKCDLCDGNPKCLSACQHGVLSFLKGRSITSYFRDEDVFSPGVPNCTGCGIELGMRFTFKVLGKDTFVFGAPGCSVFLTRGVSTEALCKLPTYMCLMTNVPSTATGVSRYYRHIGKDIKTVVFIGDGSAVDVGFQPLSGAAERGENLIVICSDNEGYQATGNQRSGSTSQFSRTSTTPVGGKWQGKPQSPKYMPLIMAFHEIPYVATAVMSYPEDYAAKLEKAMAVKNGMSYIHLFSSCPTGWGARTEDTIEIGRRAVETNYFPLWETENGKFRITHQVNKPKPIEEFTNFMGRFSHLKEKDLAELQQSVDDRLELIDNLCKMSDK